MEVLPMIGEMVPFVMLTAMAWGLAVLARRVLGRERLRRSVRWLRFLPVAVFLAGLDLSH